MQTVTYTTPTDWTAQVQRIYAQHPADHYFVLVDTNTYAACLQPALDALPADLQVITIPAGEETKSLSTLAHVWQALIQGGATRHSFLFCLGGGVITDLGGFAASTYKRGIPFANVPTTLLAMVDAAVGGKTGINFQGLKNEVGVFSEATEVLINAHFLATLDAPNLRSGFAEMLKHALLSDRAMWAAHLQYDLEAHSFDHLQSLIAQSIATKQRIVQADPHERGLRKALNLGHTVGHAFESLALERHTPQLHGYAVAWGLLCELYLSVVHCQFPIDVMRSTVDFIRSAYGTFPITCHDYEALYRFMQHDKKNEGTHINFTLMRNIGEPQLDCHLTPETLFEAFDFFREG